jgi:ABC-type phosphate/phosphonate transport system substrate-binding protein
LRGVARKAFFFEKKKQKTFVLWCAPRRQHTPNGKSFLVLFFKKEHPFLLHRPMTVAALPMYDFPELRWATDALWAAIAARVPGAPARLERHRPPMEVWTDPDLLLAQSCGYPLVTSLAGKVRLVAVPRYRAAGCAGIWYRSAVIVREADRAVRLEDLRGRRCAVNGMDSNSGMNLLRAAVAPAAVDGRFFHEVSITGAHEASVGAVARGDADVAAIDCVTWAQLQRLRPGFVAGLRLLAWTAATPGLPLITSLRTDSDTRDRLVCALDDLMADATLAPVRDALLIDGFESVSLGAYDAVLDVENHAVELGYAALG